MASVSSTARADRRDGPLLLFLHGLSGSSATYDEVRASFDTTHRVFSLDFHGHGASGRAPGTYQVPNYGADVAAFIEWIGRPVALAGHSLGGAVATYLAGARSDLVTGALLEDPPLYHGDREFFATTIFPEVFELMRDTMRRLHDGGGGTRRGPCGAPRPAGGDRRRSRRRGHPGHDREPCRRLPRLRSVRFRPGDHGRCRSVAGIPTPRSRTRCHSRCSGPIPPSTRRSFPTTNRGSSAPRPHADRRDQRSPHGIHAYAASTDRYLTELRALLDRAVGR